MSYQNQSFGIMDEGYFVARSQILGWLNELLDLNLTKIEQLGSGAVYCQVIDVIHPGSIAMNKVNWKAKNDYEFISNLKVLQNGFAKVGIKRYVEVEKLSKAKYQDNLEFIQWLKRYYDKNCGSRPQNYNPQERRGGVAIDMGFADKNVTAKIYNANGLVVSNNSVVLNKSKKEKPTIKMTSIPQKTIPQRKLGTNLNNQLNHQNIQLLTDKFNGLEMRINMIKEVVNSGDTSDIKIKLIEQILSPQRPEEQEEEEYKNIEAKQNVQQQLEEEEEMI